MSDSLSLPSLLPALLQSATGTSSQSNNGLSNSSATAFALMLAQALIQVALNSQGSSPFSSSTGSGSAFDPSSLLSGLLSSNFTNTLAGQTYAPGIATRAYQNANGWSFDPVTISAGAQTNQPTTANTTAATPTASTTTTAPVTAVAPAAQSDLLTSGALPLSAFPRPADDNGRGMHWIPTTASTPEVVDKFVDEMAQMKVKWAIILNDGTDMSKNDYLVNKLVANGIEPVMRVFTSGLQPVSGDLGAMVQHYKALGVDYFQLYNEPNHPIENDGGTPDVNKYLDLWIPAAKTVIENGGLPGFGALSPGGSEPGSEGRADDREFLRSALQSIKARGETAVLDRAWLSAHNYMGDRPIANPDGLLRVQQYDQIINEELGRSMPIVGTEGGSYTVGSVPEAVQTSLVTSAMRYMQTSPDPYNFAYSYWVIANSLGGGHDQSFEWQALFQSGHTSPIVDALKSL